MNRFRLAMLCFLVFSLMLVVGCGKNKDPDNPEPTTDTVVNEIMLEFEVIDQVAIDTPTKAQIEQHLLVSDTVKKADLEALLKQQYNLAIKQRGFKYHSKPTNVYLYCYDTKEKAIAGQGLWVAMLVKGPDDDVPQITINDPVLSQVGKASDNKYGLSESQRKSIFKDITAAELRADNEALKNNARDINELKKQAEHRNQLIDKYLSDITVNHDITREVLNKIRLEGVQNNWPMTQI